MVFPVRIERADESVFARPAGQWPSAALLGWWSADHALPPGFRFAAGARSRQDLRCVERRIEVDQTNQSVIVDEQVVVKWITTPLCGPHPAPGRLRRLTQAGFEATPAVWFVLEWITPQGHWVPIATAVDLVTDAADGWTWCMQEARVALGLSEGTSIPFAEKLGALAAGMHRALADSPTGPVAVHGDFHVGQILRDGEAKLFVVDFDGNPMLSADQRMLHRPAAYDVAGMLLSLENVGHVVAKYHPQVPDSDIVAWTSHVQREFLASYQESAGSLLDQSLLGAFIEDQIQRELAYANAHLPEWRYVPEAALRRRGRL
jgi:maltokinase